MVVEKKLAHSSPIVTRMSIGTDLDTGEVYAEEYGKQVKGQMSINDWNAVQEKAGKAVVDGKTIDTSTGEILEEPTVEKNVVVDFRAIRQA